MRENPIGLDGIDFVEFAGPRPEELEALFNRFGFAKVGRHKTKKVDLFRQGDVTFVLNHETGTFGDRFQKAHGPSICAMAFRVKDAKAAYQSAKARGARVEEGARSGYLSQEPPTMYGIGDSLIYFTDVYGGRHTLLKHDFEIDWGQWDHQGKGFFRVDHLTNNVPRGDMQKWCDFYEGIFNFEERRYFDIKGEKTGLISKVMMSPCRKIIIPINEPTETKSQIQEYLDEYKGSGVQHLALLTEDICKSVDGLRKEGVGFLDVPSTYYKMISDRVPNVTERLDRLEDLRVLVDGDDSGYLLQIFTKNVIGPIFFEIIQRKGHDGFGEGNFQALFDAIERDQMARGYLA